MLALAVWALWSYRTGGLLSVLLDSPTEGVSRLESLRAYVASWGALAPLVYVLAVTVEVLVAPIPGTLLYAPAGAIFGGFVGGTLSLLGNVLGAAIAAWVAGTFGQRWRERHDHSLLARLQERLASRGAWVVFLLRVNPFTSSDLVSYAAGLAGVKPHQVAARHARRHGAALLRAGLPGAINLRMAVACGPDCAGRGAPGGGHCRHRVEPAPASCETWIDYRIGDHATDT